MLGKRAGEFLWFLPRTAAVRQTHPVQCREEEREKTEGAWNLSDQIFDAYMEFCLGRCHVTKFAEKEMNLTAQMEGEASLEILRTLLNLHCHIVLGAEEAIERGFARLEPNMSEVQSDPFYYGYYLYLKALYLKTPDQTEYAKDRIYELFQKADDHKGYLLWMLIYLDEKLAYDFGLQLQKIKRFMIQAGAAAFYGLRPSAFWNQDHSRAKKITDFAESHSFLWGPCLTIPVYSLVHKDKGFSEELLFDLILSFQREESKEGLQAICSMLIRETVPIGVIIYIFKKAVRAGIQMIGLQESYLHYDSKTDIRILRRKECTAVIFRTATVWQPERAYLYANLVKNRRKYEAVFPSF